MLPSSSYPQSSNKKDRWWLSGFKKCIHVYNPPEFSPFIDPISEFGCYKSWQNDNQEFNQYNTKVVQGSWAKWQKEGIGEGEG